MDEQYESAEDFEVFSKLYYDLHTEYLLAFFHNKDFMDADQRHAFKVLYLEHSSPLARFQRKYCDGLGSGIPREQMTSALESLTSMESILNNFVSVKALAA